ncbi:Transmembrane protein 41A [Dermatophagoides pteronyssinus]|uniref:Transmembrane protein 41A n=1 Tax=Dermatophagoides pteronyssinus TaxID=6956 RepID=A0ABQ8J4C4_DERPT|nr:Transmembrane protein 41A [Dermatophagoides pteronyssinus]
MAQNYNKFTIWLRLLSILLIFFASILWLLFLVQIVRPDINDQIDVDNQQSNEAESNVSGNIPNADDDDDEKPIIVLAFPSNIKQLKRLARILSFYSKNHSNYVFVLFCSAYLFKQTFAIPGSVFLNLLAGAIYNVWIGFPLCCLLTACGSTLCFLLSKYFGHYLLEYYFPEKLDYFQKKFIEKQQQNGNLFWLLISLRLFPITPNWFLNIASPIVNIPLSLFFLSILFGLMPYNFICVQTGSILSEINSMNDIFTIKTFILSLFIAFLVASSTLLKKKMKKTKMMMMMKKEENSITDTSIAKHNDDGGDHHHFGSKLKSN